MTPVPVGLDACRAALGPDFVRPFVSRLELMGVDVVRLAELGTAYSFRVGDRAVIAVPASGNWFNENFGLAHELAHLSLGHEGITPGGDGVDEAEREANAFAAELLMPEAAVRAHDWRELPPTSVADLVWQWGVSTQALATRLSSLRVPVSEGVRELLALKTQALLRRHWAGGRHGDPITERMAAASARHFPEWLQQAHLDRIAAGTLRKDTLAWMLDVAPERLEVEEPETPDPLGRADLMDLLG